MFNPPEGLPQIMSHPVPAVEGHWAQLEHFLLVSASVHLPLLLASLYKLSGKPSEFPADERFSRSISALPLSLLMHSLI